MYGFIIITLLYGGGALLIREARIRWDLGWSIIFLAIAYGILEEGLLMQSFFNQNHEDLNELSKYGYWLKTHWPWTIELIIYHATISTLIPILITDLVFPKVKNQPFLNKGGMITFIILITLETLAIGATIIVAGRDMADPYIADPIVLGVCALVMFMSIYLAYHYRSKRSVDTKARLLNPFKLGLYAFLMAACVLLLPSSLASLSVPAVITTLAMLVLSAVVLLFGFTQMLHRDITKRHQVAVSVGTVLVFVALSPIMQFSNGQPAMFAVGLATLALLIAFAIGVLRN